MQIIGANLTPKKVSVLCKVEEEHEHACACGDTTHSLVEVDVDIKALQEYDIHIAQFSAGGRDFSASIDASEL